MDTFTELHQLADDLTELGDDATAVLVRQAIVTRRAGVQYILGVMMTLAVLALRVGAAGPSADLALAQPKIGENSCQGVDACTGLIADAGDNSCNGQRACFNASAAVGDNSCNGFRVCEGSSGPVEDSSCNGDFACEGNTGMAGDGSV